MDARGLLSSLLLLLRSSRGYYMNSDSDIKEKHSKIIISYTWEVYVFRIRFFAIYFHKGYCSYKACRTSAAWTVQCAQSVTNLFAFFFFFFFFINFILGFFFLNSFDRIIEFNVNVMGVVRGKGKTFMKNYRFVTDSWIKSRVIIKGWHHDWEFPLCCLSPSFCI